MSPPLDKPTPRTEPGLLNIIVYTPKGSRSKLKYDEEIACFRLSRILPVGCYFLFSVRTDLGPLQAIQLE